MVRPVKDGRRQCGRDSAPDGGGRRLGGCDGGRGRRRRRARDRSVQVVGRRAVDLGLGRTNRRRSVCLQTPDRRRGGGGGGRGRRAQRLRHGAQRRTPSCWDRCRLGRGRGRGPGRGDRQVDQKRAWRTARPGWDRGPGCGAGPDGQRLQTPPPAVDVVRPRGQRQLEVVIDQGVRQRLRTHTTCAPRRARNAGVRELSASRAAVLLKQRTRRAGDGPVSWLESASARTTWSTRARVANRARCTAVIVRVSSAAMTMDPRACSSDGSMRTQRSSRHSGPSTSRTSSGPTARTSTAGAWLAGAAIHAAVVSAATATSAGAQAAASVWAGTRACACACS